MNKKFLRPVEWSKSISTQPHILAGRYMLAWWPHDTTQTIAVRASELQILLAQGNPIKAGIPKDWRCVAHAANDIVAKVS